MPGLGVSVASRREVIAFYYSSRMAGAMTGLGASVASLREAIAFLVRVLKCIGI